MWTHRDLELVARIAPARSCQTAARIVGKPEAAVRAKFEADGLARRDWTAADNEALRGMLSRYAVVTIAAKLDRSPEEIVAQAERMNWFVDDAPDPDSPYWKDDDDEY